MSFLYPTSRQFPFDEICEQIVRELERRNWNVPGIEVTFCDNHSGNQYVQSITSEQYELFFLREQGRLPSGTANIAAVNRISIPQRIISVYSDESGPSYYVYVGDNYERDRTEFMHGRRIHSKLDGKPKTYLQYQGQCDCKRTEGASFSALDFLAAKVAGDREALARLYHRHRNTRSPLLVHDNDCGREYDPVGAEPRVFRTSDIMDEFTKYLMNVVLPMILRK